MKKLITLLAIGAGFAVMAPTSSQARDGHGGSSSFSHRCGSCGSSVYRQQVITGYDRHGHPVYGWRTASHSCRTSYEGHGGSHGGGHSSGHGGGHGGGHISLPGFHFDFGRGRH